MVVTEPQATSIFPIGTSSPECWDESGYSGTVSETANGITCQRWDSNFPHAPKFQPESNNHNFCRNPGSDYESQ